jgi:hypothetical protein
MPVGVCLHLSMGMSMSIGMSRAYRVVMSIVFLIFSIESDEAHAGGSAEVARWVGWADPGESGVILYEFVVWMVLVVRSNNGCRSVD